VCLQKIVSNGLGKGSEKGNPVFNAIEVEEGSEEGRFVSNGLGKGSEEGNSVSNAIEVEEGSAEERSAEGNLVSNDDSRYRLS